MSLLPPRKRSTRQPTTTSGGNLPPLPPLDERIIRNVEPDWELSKITGLKKSTIYKHEGMGTFPPRVKITGKSSGWRLSQVRQWIEGKRDWRAAP